MVRRRLTVVGVVAAAAALVLSGCANQGDAGGGQTAAAPAPSAPADAAMPQGNGQGRCAPGTSIAYVGTIAGESPALGEPVYNSTKLAIDQHNAANPNCQVTFKQFDSGGTGATAIGPTTAAITDPTILGVVGLPFSGESKAVGPAMNTAGLVNISPSATNPALTQNGWTNFFRALGNDAVQGPAAARFISEQFKPTTVCIIRDDSDYGVGLADQITQALGPQVASCQESVKSKQVDFAAVVGKVQQVNPQAVFYSGYYPEAAPLVQQLKDRGVAAPFVAPDGTKDEAYVTNSGGAAEGTFLTCPCVPSSGFTAYTDAYQQAFGKAPGSYGAEAYDSATILLSGIDKGAADRPSLLNYVRGYQGQGLTKRFSWQPNGELTQTPLWSYKVSGGQIVPERSIA